MIILSLLASPMTRRVLNRLSQITSHHTCVIGAARGLQMAYHNPGVIPEGESPLSFAVPTATLSRFYTFGV